MSGLVNTKIIKQVGKKMGLLINSSKTGPSRTPNHLADVHKH